MFGNTVGNHRKFSGIWQVCMLLSARLGVGLGWHNAVTRAYTATLTGLSTPWDVTMIVWGRGAVGCHLTSAVLR